MQIGFLGLGIMGAPMARHLAAKGHEVRVWNRTRARAEALAGERLTVADSPRAAAVGAQVVCTNLADPAALESVVFGDDGVLPALEAGATLVDFSTISPDFAQRLEAACEAKGAFFLESPVTGSKSGAESGTLLAMCGARPEVFERLQPVLACVTKQAILVGPVGHASVVKLIGNLCLAHMMEGLAEGAAIAKGSGVKLETVLEVFRASGYASPFWDFKGRALAQADFDTHFSIDLMHKDLSLAMGMGDALQVPMPGTAAIREVYQAVRARGLGGLDFAATASLHDPSLVKETK